MEKGVDKHWTPGKELEYQERLKLCRTFAERHLVMLTRDILKYDMRSKEGNRAIAQARLRLAVATDEDLKELAELEVLVGKERPGEIPGFNKSIVENQRLEKLKKQRSVIREKGINRSELVCR